MNYAFFSVAGVFLLIAFSAFLVGCAPVSKPMRMVPKKGEVLAQGKSSFIETKAIKTPYSCSFVEFDGRGDFIDFQQHQHCWSKIQEFAKDEGVLLVMYCHGWKNNSQSGDVLRFNSFLSRLAKSEKVKGSGLRVHGVFLSWQGNLFRPQVDLDDSNPHYKRTTADYGDAIVNPEWSRRSTWTAFLPEQLTYYNRKRAAEHKVSGIALTRAVYTYAGVARKTQSGNSKGIANRVFLIGHSFGALMLEQSVLQGSVGALASQWDWFNQTSGGAPIEKILPFDFLLLVNSAAPSIYAKQMRDFLSSHDKALRKGRWEKGERPLVVSLTSSADKATRYLHALANTPTRLYPSMQRSYDERLLKTPERGEKHRPIHQSEFYRATPGHNHFLLNRWIELDDDPTENLAGKDPFEANLELPRKSTDFFLSPAPGSSEAHWQISKTPPPGQELKKVGNLEVDPWDGAYWFVRCDKRHIQDHGDIWSDRAMEIYAALYRMSWSLGK